MMIKNYDEFCAGFGKDSARRTAEILFLIRNSFASLQTIKHAGILTIDDVIDGWECAAQTPKDYLAPSTEKMFEVFDRVVDNLNFRIRHENVLMPSRTANEVNGKTVAWLSRRNGRNIGEKIAGSASIMAVLRRMSFDTVENRLLKELAFRLSDAIFLKNRSLPAEFLNADEKFLLDRLRQFLHSSTADEIGDWKNVPPNDALLTDRFYSVIWRAWEEFRQIDERIVDDCKNIDQRLCTAAQILLLPIIGRRFDFPQQPIFFDDRNCELRFSDKSIYAVNRARDAVFKMTPRATEILLAYGGGSIRLKFAELRLFISDDDGQSRKIDLTAEKFFSELSNAIRQLLGEEFSQIKPPSAMQSIAKSTAIADVFSLRPEILSDGKRFISPGALMFQQIGNFELNCFRARALTISDNDAPSFRTFERAVDEEDRIRLDCLTAQLKKFVDTEEITLVCPDACNEFQLSTLKRSMKLRYNKVRILPKSIAAAFNYSRTKHFANEFAVGDTIIVVDRISEGCSFTPLKSRFDAFVASDIPQSKGIVWERMPSHSVEPNYRGAIGVEERIFLSTMSLKDFIAEIRRTACIDRNGRLKKFSAVERPKNIRLPIKDALENFIAENRSAFGNNIWIMPLSGEPDCGGLNFRVINYADQSVLGGVEVFDTLRRQTDVSLWRDRLPSLSIKRLFGNFDLIRNEVFECETSEMLIPISETFTLSKGLPEYHFGLKMFGGNDKHVYEAVLEHDKFPLPNDVDCRAIMKYTPAEENPYSLKFVPLEKKSAGFKAVTVRWARVDSYAYKNLPYRKFPETPSWDELRAFSTPVGKDDLLKRAIRLLDEITELPFKIKINPERFSEKASAVYTRTAVRDKDAVVYSAAKKFRPDETVYAWMTLDGESERYSIDVSNGEWIFNLNNEWQLDAEIFFDDGVYRRISFFKNNFVFPQEFSRDAKVLNYELDPADNSDTLAARKILVEYERPPLIYRVDKITDEHAMYDIDKFNRFSRRLMFCLEKICFNGKSTDQFDCPPYVAINLKTGLKRFYDMYRELAPHSPERLEAFKMLCLASKDADPHFRSDAAEYISDCVKSPSTEESAYAVGFLLDDFSKTWQCDLLDQLEDYPPKLLIGMLSSAARRNENFIKNLPFERTRKYFETAIKIFIETKEMFVPTLDFLMSIFRLRELGDDDLNWQLSPNNPRLRELCSAIEKFIAENQLAKSDLRLAIDVIKCLKGVENP